MNLDVLPMKLTAEQAEKFEKYYELLTGWNKVMNLTAITGPDDVALRHFADSLTVLPYIDRIAESAEAAKEAKTGAISVVDVGTGAGFPGIPLKIMRPQLEVTLLDSLEKRLRFLDAVIGELGLENIRTVHARAEDAGRKGQYRERFDAAVARAVAPMNILAEYCLPLVRQGGQFIAMKGPAEERFDSALRELRGELISDDIFELGDEEKLTRRIICVAKTGKTPQKYPRKAGTPSKTPL
ncbi:MAG: 16S rRNA (guanine(527)-N(7))-methyltransferase RsmG [Clostridia bacterium]|nr:16S rRNA (guanine(527)-N(7))-methyltransferase RsmG [Clostridia bacterium]